MSEKDLYAVLGVERSISPEDLTKAYRKLAMKYHPDRNQNDKTAEEKFKEIQKAYSILSDPQKRAQYDQFGSAAFDGSQMGGGFNTQFDFGDIGDIFSQMFGGGGRRQEQNYKGADLQYELTISLAEAAQGIKKSITIPSHEECDLCHGSGAKAGTKPETCSTCHGKGYIHVRQAIFQVQQPCPTCHGKGRVIKEPCIKCHGDGVVKTNKKLEVSIPAGIDNGQSIRLSGQGQPGRNSASSGDLYVRIRIKAHEFFERDGKDLHCEVPISFTTAALGGEVEVPTLDGKANMKIPIGTQSGKVLRLKGKGIRSLRSTLEGDLYCHIVVETPINLTDRQKEILGEFQDISSSRKQSQSPRENGFFDKIKNLFN